MAAALEFMSKLTVPFWCFHDWDIAPEGRRSRSPPATSTTWRSWPVGTRTGRVSGCCGARQALRQPAVHGRRATNPDPEVFAYAAGQVAHCMNVTHRLGGSNYVLWGGREGYETLLNTDMKRELAQLGRFMNLVVEHKHAIGFEGTILIEPKPFEPTKHQYDYDVAGGLRLLQEHVPGGRDQGQHRGQPRHSRRA